MSLGKRLKTERERNGWSQLYVAKKIGITNTVLSNYERDYRDPDTDTLGKLAGIYRVSVDYLLKGEIFTATENRELYMIPFETEAAVPDENTDFHLFDTDGVQFIARSNKKLSPKAYQKMQELAKKAKELL